MKDNKGVARNPKWKDRKYNGQYRKIPKWQLEAVNRRTIDAMAKIKRPKILSITQKTTDCAIPTDQQIEVNSYVPEEQTASVSLVAPVTLLSNDKTIMLYIIRK